MASIVVTGGGMAGLTAAMLLADDGHEVLVLERDPALPPGPADAWESWTRRGVNQFRLVPLPAARASGSRSERALPRVVAALEEAGGTASQRRSRERRRS